MNKDKCKATWDVSSTEIFIHECIDQIYKKERQGSSFTKDGWKYIRCAFNEKSGRSYDKKQLKNRFDSLRKEWKAWEKLFLRETGIAFNAARNMVIAEDEWWERKIQENGEYAKYRYRGLRFAKELEIIFKDVMASGSTMFTPSSAQQQMSVGAQQQMSEGDDEDDVYRPTMDLEEGSGDSEEDLEGPTAGGSVGVTSDFEGITMTTNTAPSAPSGSGGSGKRKRDAGFKKSNKRPTTTSKAIADAVSRIADATTDRLQDIRKMSAGDALASDVISELLTIPEVVSNRDFRRRCCNMMMHQMPRDMFCGLKGNKEALLEWLEEHAYNSPHLQIAPKP